MNLLAHTDNKQNFTLTKKHFSPSINATDGLEIREITKIAEKLKWLERFYKSYTGGKKKVSVENVALCKMFLAIYKGKEAGYIRIASCTNQFSNLFNGEVFAINEGYVKPAYRSNGILTYLRSYVVKHHNVKFMRIETERYFKLEDYYAQQGFVYGYKVLGNDLSVICLPDFFDTLIAYGEYISKH